MREFLREIEVERPYNFIFGGNAEFTVRNVLNGKSYKYKVKRSKKNRNVYSVRVMVENGAFIYAGYLLNKPYAKYAKGKYGNMEADTEQIRGLMYAIKHGSRALNRPMIMTHHGKCACCGKPLNDEISILRGFGPTCWQRIEDRREER